MNPRATVQRGERPSKGRARTFHFHLLAAGLAAAALVVLAGCSGKGHHGAQRSGAPVTVAKAQQRDIPVEINTIGNVQAYSTVNVNARVGGELIKVAFKEGDDVKKGQLLFQLDPRPYAAALTQARAKLKGDTAQAENARADVKRYALLIQKDYVNQSQFDQVKANAQALEAAVDADKAAVRQAELNLGYCTITSPINGRTGSLLVHEGNLVKANDANPMVVINQIKPVYVTFSVPENDLGEIRARAREGRLAVQVKPDGDDAKSYSGTLSFVNNQVDTTTGTVMLKATFPNQEEGLWPGQFVNVSLVLSEMKNAVVVPSQAVQTGQKGTYLYIVKPDKTADLRPVETGPDHDGVTVIKSGVKAGETVVTEGQLLLRPGAPVSIKNEAGQEDRGE